MIRLWLIGLVALALVACAPRNTPQAEQDARLDALEQVITTQSATLQRIEAAVSAIAESSDRDAAFTETLARTVAEVREYARGSACISTYIVYITGMADESIFEYYVHRPVTDCEPPKGDPS